MFVYVLVFETEDEMVHWLVSILGGDNKTREMDIPLAGIVFTLSKEDKFNKFIQVRMHS